MILLLDRGNTRVKWRLVNDQEQTVAEAVDEDGLAQLSAALTTPPSPELALLACVAGDDVAAKLERNLRRKIPAITFMRILVRPSFRGFSPVYQDEQAMGVDRWLQLLAVRSKGLFPAMVVSVGTAITVDKLNSIGKHEGGLIAPGWKMLSGVVQRSTARIEVGLPVEPNPEGLGVSTTSCLHAGVSHMLKAFIMRVDREFGRGCECKLISGGDSEYIAAWLTDYKRSEALVLEGLAVVASHLDEYKSSL